jgi:hypothetical protein
MAPEGIAASPSTVAARQRWLRNRQGPAIQRSRFLSRNNTLHSCLSDICPAEGMPDLAGLSISLTNFAEP